VLILKDLLWRGMGERVTAMDGKSLREFEGLPGGHGSRALVKDNFKWFGWREITRRERPVCPRFPSRFPSTVTSASDNFTLPKAT
jgi:hypothetical protein